jgi:hypothetical protein
MARYRAWRCLVVGGTLLAALALDATGASGQAAGAALSTSPTYAIPLKDRGTAVVWWDAVSDPAHPGWRCEVPGERGAGAGRTIFPLAAPAGDWQAALAEAKALLRARLVENE